MLNVACIISGNGSFVEAIQQRREESRYSSIRPALVIADRPGIMGLARAAHAGIPAKDILTVPRAEYPNAMEWGEAVHRECNIRAIDVLGLYGCLSKIPENLIGYYHHRSVNSHPGPLDPGRPDFGGEGMYKLRVHKAVMEFFKKTHRSFPSEPYGEDGKFNRQYWTLVTAQRVERQYDQGQVIGEELVLWCELDTPESLAARALAVEHALQMRVLLGFATGTTRSLRRRHPLILSIEEPLLHRAKADAIAAYPVRKLAKQ